MKFATLADGHPDGRLLIVSRDLRRFVAAEAATTLQAALDDWRAAEPALQAQYRALDEDPASGTAVDATRLMAAMPRSYQFLDGSAFLAHNHILADAWGYERRTPADPPLMYQGLSDRFYPAHGDVAFRSADDEIDFEAEYGVITDAVPMGISATDALRHVRLLLIVNDWSLRAFGPGEMKGGFGFLHAKPPSSLSPFAVTPDELGDAWTGGRVALPLRIERNGEPFGQPDGAQMTYDFGVLLAHAARTRDLCAGTVIGSGTVSNADAATTGSGCIAERRALDKLAGRAPTPYLAHGDRVTLTTTDRAGAPVFGSIGQRIVIA